MRKIIMYTTLASTLVAACGKNNKKVVINTGNKYSVNFEQMHKKYPQCNTKKYKTYGDYEKCDLSLKDSMFRVGDPKAPIKIVFLQGGPMAWFEDKKSYYVKRMRADDQWAVAQGIEYIWVNQSWWSKRSQFKNNETYDVEDAKKETDEMLKRTHNIVNHFKDKGFKVILMGASYGGMVMNEYILQYGAQTADKYYQVVGRIDNSKSVKMKIKDKKAYIKYYNVDNQLGEYVRFGKEKGFFEKIYLFFKGLNNTSVVHFINTTSEAIAKDYTKLLADKDLSKVTYINSIGDKHVGYLNQKELDFVKAKGAGLKQFSVEEVKASKAKWEKETGTTYGGSMGSTWMTYAHKMPTTEENVIKYILEPVGWNKETDYDSSVSYYKVQYEK